MINEFRGQYFFLSNFYKSTFYIKDLKILTVEHFFQAMKATNYDDFINIINSDSASDAKYWGNKIKIREDWLDIRNRVMYYALCKKFENNFLRKKLLATGNQELIEGNTWNDKYWGICSRTNVGENMLGKMLMHIRKSYERN